MSSRRPGHRANKYADLASALSAPTDVEAYAFAIGSEEYVVLKFELTADDATTGITEALTESERAVASLVMQGRTNSQIARVRGRSTQTIANQLGAIYRKLGVKSRRELAARLQESRRRGSGQGYVGGGGRALV